MSESNCIQKHESHHLEVLHDNLMEFFSTQKKSNLTCGVHNDVGT